MAVEGTNKCYNLIRQVLPKRESLNVFNCTNEILQLDKLQWHLREENASKNVAREVFVSCLCVCVLEQELPTVSATRR